LCTAVIDYDLPAYTPGWYYYYDPIGGLYDSNNSPNDGICVRVHVIAYTPTPSPSISISPTSSLTPTPSISVTPSATISTTNTPSATSSASISASPTISTTNSASSTAGPSNSATPSISTTASATPTSSPSTTTSLSPTSSPSLTASPSLTPSPTVSLSGTPSPSPSAIPCHHPGATLQRAEEWLNAIDCDIVPSHDMTYKVAPFTSTYTVGVGLQGCQPTDSHEGDCSGTILFYHTCRGKTNPNPCHGQADFLAASVSLFCAGYEKDPYPEAICYTNQKISDNVISHSPFVCSSAPPQPTKPAPSPHPLSFS